METEVVERHLTLCDDILNILNEENRMLRRDPPKVEDSLLDEKRSLLPQLDASLAALKAMHAENPDLHATVKEKLKSAEKKIMRILLLDRENEQLLLKSLMPKTGKKMSKPSISSVKSIYEKHRI